MYFDADLGTVCTLGMYTALGLDRNVWTTWNVTALRRCSKLAASV